MRGTPALKPLLYLSLSPVKLSQLPESTLSQKGPTDHIQSPVLANHSMVWSDWIGCKHLNSCSLSTNRLSVFPQTSNIGISWPVKTYSRLPFPPQCTSWSDIPGTGFWSLCQWCISHHTYKRRLGWGSSGSSAWRTPTEQRDHMLGNKVTKKQRSPHNEL